MEQLPRQDDDPCSTAASDQAWPDASGLPGRILVTAGILWDGERVLACQRRAGTRFGLKWEFPGGKVEAGESLEASLARELSEELGIAATVGAEVHRTDHTYPGTIGVRLVFFHVRRYEGVPRNLAFEQVAWLRPAELAGYDFLDADRAVVARLAAGEIHFP
jgi:8-oxo-dGTP diphosphatase